jgi:hypothetical protein
MTLFAYPIQPAGAFMPAGEPDSRALSHARLLRGWMEDKGLKAPSLALSVERQGQQISPDYIRKLTRGERELASMPLDLREAVRRALRVSASDWENSTGLATAADIDPDPVDSPAPLRYSAGARGWKVPKQEPVPIPDALLEAARIYGENAEFAGIREYRWQRWMTESPHKQRPSTPEEWLGFYMSVKDRFNPTEPKE